MKACFQNLVFGSLLVLGLLLVPEPSIAKINGFRLNGIEGLGDGCGLDNRIGKTSDATEHVINIEDCKKYSGCSLKISWSLQNQPASDAVHVVKVSKPGGACSDTDLTTLGDSCLPTFAVSESPITAYTNMSFNVLFDELTGGNCAAGTDLSTKVVIVIKELGAIAAESILFKVDLKAPLAPELEEPIEGDSNVTVVWKDPANEGEVDIKYHVYWATERFDDATKKAIAKREPAVTGRSYQVGSLENGKEYWFAVSAVDVNGNEGPLSPVTSTMPIEVLDFFEAYRTGSEVGREEGGFCFIATAAYGSYSAPDVWMLRRFRDEVLMTTSLGRAFVRTYYEVSPPIAKQIAGSEPAKAGVRLALKPFVLMASLLLKVPSVLGSAVLVFMLLLPAAATVMVVRRVIRRRS
ncbi:MAG TPA: fibronectin type III domain-containing protein [Oligoflexales bacterium]|nr:fibronectin type III domain-containing protein [Oligoflexales bacterium]